MPNQSRTQEDSDDASNQRTSEAKVQRTVLDAGAAMPKAAVMGAARRRNRHMAPINKKQTDSASGAGDCDTNG